MVEAGPDRGLPFKARLAEAVKRKGGSLCVGIDPVPAELPGHFSRDREGVRQYCLQLIEATSVYATAFKPNAGFFEALGSFGWELLAEVVREAARNCLVVVDAKLGDVGHTASAYATAIFDVLGADACTVNAYLGADSVAPFLSRPDRLAFVVCRTSNKGAADLQDLELKASGEPLYLHLARLAAGWDQLPPTGTVGVVAGATWPRELAALRRVAPTLPILIPGVGAQGGELESSVAAAIGATGQAPYLLSISRGIGLASKGEDFASAAASAAAGYLARLRQVHAPAAV